MGDDGAVASAPHDRAGRPGDDLGRIASVRARGDPTGRELPGVRDATDHADRDTKRRVHRRQNGSDRRGGVQFRGRHGAGDHRLEFPVGVPPLDALVHAGGTEVRRPDTVDGALVRRAIVVVLAIPRQSYLYRHRTGFLRSLRYV